MGLTNPKFIILPYERRGRVNGEEPREIPIRDVRPAFWTIVTTSGKLLGIILGFLAVLVPTVIWLTSGRFETIVDKRFSDFELRLTREYALKSDTVTRVEYNLRHQELIDMDRAMSERMTELERRMNNISHNGNHNGHK